MSGRPSHLSARELVEESIIASLYLKLVVVAGFSPGSLASLHTPNLCPQRALRFSRDSRWFALVLGLTEFLFKHICLKGSLLSISWVLAEYSIPLRKFDSVNLHVTTHAQSRGTRMSVVVSKLMANVM